jgi:photosystem II P680 reaction center D1 protein
MSTGMRGACSQSLEGFCQWVTSITNRIDGGGFGLLMIPCLLAAPSAS